MVHIKQVDITLEDIESAYRKLKSYIYYDNYSILLRQKLANYESEVTLDNEFNIILTFLQDPESNNSKEYFNKLLADVKYTIVPKSFKKDDLDDDFVLTNNFTSSHYDIDKVNYLIDAPIPIHIISVLWIIKEGYVLAKEYKKSNYANVLETDPDTKEVVEGLRLFKPYFEQYQKWRDSSVETALNFIDKDVDVVIVGLDIKEYYYNVNFNPVTKSTLIRKIKHELNLDTDIPEPPKLTEILFQIHDAYIANLKSNGHKTKCKKFLPIGLLSSGILANWYLRDFDKQVLDKLSPAFYGRYVDDILIVLANTNVPVYEKDVEKKFYSSMELFFEKFFREQGILTDNFPVKKIDRIPDGIKDPEEIQKQLDKYYYSWTKRKSIKIQKNKISLQAFNCKESKAVLERFKQNIQKNSSAFWFLPDETEVNKSFDESVYELTYSDTVNKLRSVSAIKQNKYGASVFLAKKIKLSLLANQKYDEKTRDQILTFFKGRMNLEFSSVWEKVLTYFLINNDWKSFWSFFYETYTSIKRIKIKCEDAGKETHKMVHENLFAYLSNCSAMALALNSNFVNDYLTRKFKANKDVNIDSILEYASCFRKANLLRHNMVATPLINFTKTQLDEKCNYVKFTKFLENDLDDVKLKYSPRYIYFSEFCLFYNLKTIAPVKAELAMNNEFSIQNLYFDRKNETFENVLHEAFDKYYYTNHESRKFLDPNGENYENDKSKVREALFKYIPNEYVGSSIYADRIIIPQSGKIEEYFTIAVANTKVDKKNIFASIVDKANATEERSSQLINILNQSEEVKADALLLPEVSFPFQYLFQIADEARRKQRLIIAGLEHLRIKDVCYNFVATCLPLEYNGIKDVVVVLRLKNHYSPHEQNTIVDNGRIIPKPEPATYNLFEWKDLHFSVYNCYELADIVHRSVFRSKVDLLFASEYNQDVNYFSNIVESVTRDVHCYFVQANSSDFGDSRITAPTKTVTKDILRLKGGENDVVLLGKIKIKELREFQATRLRGQDTDKFKNTPPDYKHEEAEKRLKRENKDI